MSSKSQRYNPWPAPTPAPSPSTSSLQKLKPERADIQRRSILSRRQHIIANQSGIDAAAQECELTSGNSVITCYPTDDTVIVQDEWSECVWNSRIPQFSQFNLVDVFLQRADSGETVLQFSNLTNPSNRAGSVQFQTNDTIWGVDGPNWPGHNVSFPFRFVVVPAGTPEESGLPQPIFSAIQTNFPDSVLAAMASSSAAASSSSLAAAASASLSASAFSVSTAAAAASLSLNSLASLANKSSASIANVGSNGLQDDNNGSSFPSWAIAVIVILGVLAIVAFVALMFLIMRVLRRRRANGQARRGSIGSESPMIANSRAAGVASPLLEASNTIPGGGGGHMTQVGPAPSIVSPDGASINSDGLFSGADAAVMAEAFRQALRKPDFADRPTEEGESPDTQAGIVEPRLMLNRELAEEGTGLRTVDSSRDVKVETLRDDGK